MAQVSASDLERQLALAQRELSEAREQQAATAEVLGIIASSPGELEPVFQAMLANATRLCEAKFGNLAVSMKEAPCAWSRASMCRRRLPRRAGVSDSIRIRAVALGEVIRTKQPAQVADAAATQGYAEHQVPAVVDAVELGGVRTTVNVPMLKDNELIGIIAIFRQEVRPFTDKQVALLTNFAAQAVIAIENTRLLNELRESLQQQTATSEVLSVISSSPGELAPVFNAILENATRICEAKFGTMYLCEGDALRVVAMHGAPPSYAETRRHNPVIRPRPEALLGRAFAPSRRSRSPTSGTKWTTAIRCRARPACCSPVTLAHGP